MDFGLLNRVRVEVKEVRRISVACDACKKRKGKCTGTQPCIYCVNHNVICNYTPANRSRGPRKKAKTDQYKNDFDGSIPLSSSSGEEASSVDLAATMGDLQLVTPCSFALEEELSFEVEKLQLVDSYLEQSIDTYLVGYRDKFLNPQTLSQKAMSFSVLAVMLRAGGYLQRANRLIEQARLYVAQTFDEITIDSAIACTILSRYFSVVDPKGVLYTSMAHSIAKCLPSKDPTALRLYLCTHVATLTHDTQIGRAL